MWTWRQERRSQGQRLQRRQESEGLKAFSEAGAGEGGVRAVGAEGAEPSAASGYLALRGGQRGGNHTEPAAALC